MSTTPNTGAPKLWRAIFGIFMIIVYLGMSALFFAGFFDPLYGEWKWCRWVFGGLFGVYGIWRAYRQFKGIDNPYATNSGDDE